MSVKDEEMQKVKTLFIFTFMLVILYGAYVVLYKGTAPAPDDGLTRLLKASSN
jgi:hypothetical protein